MTDRLSRRDIVLLAGAGVAGAGLAVAALKLAGPQKLSGHYPKHGKSASDPPDYDWGFSGPPFKPDFITLVHIGFEDDGKMYVNQACYAHGASDGNRRTRAIELFKLVRLPDGSRVRFGTLQGANRPYRKLGSYDHVDFDKFGFASQHEIFFYFDDPELEFDPRYLITFAPLGEDEKTPRAENYSFFNAKADKVVLHSTNGRDDGWILSVENYFTNSIGGKLDTKDKDKAKKYAMNLHFRASTTSTTSIGYIPMVLDPDTGNGAGHEP